MITNFVIQTYLAIYLNNLYKLSTSKYKDVPI